jgi:hypothetical protein
MYQAQACSASHAHVRHQNTPQRHANSTDKSGALANMANELQIGERTANSGAGCQPAGSRGVAVMFA